MEDSPNCRSDSFTCARLVPAVNSVDSDLDTSNCVQSQVNRYIWRQGYSNDARGHRDMAQVTQVVIVAVSMVSNRMPPTFTFAIDRKWCTMGSEESSIHSLTPSENRVRVQ